MTFSRLNLVIPVGTRILTLFLPCDDALNRFTVFVNVQFIVTLNTSLVVGTVFHFVPVGSVKYLLGWGPRNVGIWDASHWFGDSVLVSESPV